VEKNPEKKSPSPLELKPKESKPDTARKLGSLAVGGAKR
jgi:hypothetical protein